MPDPPSQANTWDKRPATSESPQKGLGYLGLFKLPNGGVAGEYSIAESNQLRDAKGNYLDYPTLVPTLTRNEVLAVLKAAQAPEGSPDKELPDAVYDKAEAWALGRQRQGKPLFAQPGEEYLLYPDIPRAAVQWPSGDITLPNQSGQRDPRLGTLRSGLNQAGDISLPNQSGQTDPRLGNLGYQDLRR